MNRDGSQAQASDFKCVRNTAEGHGPLRLLRFGHNAHYAQRPLSSKLWLSNPPGELKTPLNEGKD